MAAANVHWEEGVPRINADVEAAGGAHPSLAGLPVKPTERGIGWNPD
jgi:hypothetical protein